MTFREYYRSLRHQERPLHPAKAFIHQIAELTGRTPKTVSQWLSGRQRPPKEVCVQISKVLEMDAEDLFPKIKNIKE